MRVTVPLHFTNEATSVGAKKGGVVNHLMTEVEIEVLPKDLPEFIEVDVAKLDIDHTLHLSDLTVPAGITLFELTAHGNNAGVVVIHMPKGSTAEAEEAGETTEG